MRLRERLTLPPQIVEDSGAGQCLNAARARRHAAFGSNLEQADVTGAPHVRAAAELARIAAVAHGHHAYVVAIFLAEQRHGAGIDGCVKVHHLRLHFLVGQNVLVDQVFDVEHILLTEARVMREIKAQPVRRHQRPRLLHVRPQRLAQRRVQQMGGGMIAPRRDPAARNRPRP